MSNLLPLGLSIDQDVKSKTSRASDKRGYIDSDIPLLESFGILKNGKPPTDFYLSPDNYREFIDWLIEGTIEYPVDPLVLKILCYYRNKLGKGMDDIGTTDGNRLYQENIIKTINKMISGDDEKADATTMCASGGAPQAPPPDSECCEEIKPKIDAISEAIEELKNKPAFDIKVELQKLLSGSDTHSGTHSDKDYTEVLNQINGKLDELANSRASCNTDEIVEKLKPHLQSQDTSKIDGMAEQLSALTNIVTQQLATEIDETKTDVKTILEKLGIAHGNISKLLTKPKNTGLSGLEIRATQITEKASQASAEAEEALKTLNMIKANTSKSADDIEEAVEKASLAREKADKLITEAQQLWELISPSGNNSSSQEKGPVAPPAVVVPEQAPSQTANVLPVSSTETDTGNKHTVVVPSNSSIVKKVGGFIGGRGSPKDHESINTARSKLNALSASVLDAKSIIRDRRKKNRNNLASKNVEIADLKESVRKAEAELQELRQKIGTGGDHLERAIELEEKVKTLTALIKSVTGETNDLEKGVKDHLASDATSATKIEELQTKIAGLPNIDNLKTKLEQILIKIKTLEELPDLSVEVEQLKAKLADSTTNSEKQALLTKLQDALKKIATLENQPDLSQEVVLLKQLLSKSSNNSKQEKERLQEALNKISILEQRPDLSEEISRLTSEVEAAKQTHEADEREKQSLRQEINSNKNKQNPLQQKYDELVRQNESLTQTIMGKETELVTLRQKVAEIEALKQRSLTLEEGSKELEILRSKLATLEPQLEGLKSELTNKERLLNEETAKLTLLTDEKSKTLLELANTKAKLLTLTDNLSMTSEEVERLKSERSRLYEEVKQLKEQLKTGLEEKLASLEALTAERDRLKTLLADQSENKHSDEELAKVREQLATAKSKIAELNEEKDRFLSEKEGELADLNKKLKASMSQSEADSLEKVALAEELERIKAELAQTKTSRDEISGELSNIRAELAHIVQEKEALKQTVEMLKDDHTESEALDQARRDLATATDKVNRLEEQNRSLNSELQEKDARLSDMEELVSQKDASLRAFQGSNAERAEKLTSAQARLELSERTAAEQRRLLNVAQRESSTLQQRIAGLEERIASLVEEASKFRGKNTDALANIKQQLQVITSEKEQLESELVLAQSGKKQAEKSAKNAQAQAQQVRAESNSQKSQLQSALQELLTLRQSSFSLIETQRQLDELTKQSARLANELNKVKEDKGRSNSVANTQLRRAQELQKAYDSLLAKQTAGTSALETQLRTAERTIQQLGNQVQSSSRNSEMLVEAQEELDMLRLDSQQLRLALINCKQPDSRHDLPDRFVAPVKKSVPGYLAPTESKLSRNAATQKQLPKGRYAHGGKKGARFTKIKKRISPLI